MKKRILFVFPSFGIGGTTVSTRNLVSLLGKEGYDCWVMPLSPRGLLAHLYDGVQRMDTPFVIRALSGNSWKEEPSLMKKFWAASLRFVCNRFKRVERIWVGIAFDKLVDQYHIDTLVACQEGITTRFVSYASIGNKTAWVRCDYKRMMEDSGRSRENHYDVFRNIVCVSEQTSQSFKSVFPEHAAKTFCIPNPQDEAIILRQADVEENEPRFITEGKLLVSIGRLDAVKRFDQIAPIARRLIDEGMRFRWYLIGDGAERRRVEQSILDCHVQDNVIMLGAKANPYYYLKRADALVCLSRSEACPRVVNEAKILHTPTLSTDFPTIYEFIQNGETGLISSIEAMSSAILRFYGDEQLRLRLKENISQFSFDNKDLMDSIKEIL